MALGDQPEEAQASPPEEIHEDEGDFSAGAQRLHRRSVSPVKPPAAILGIVHGYGDHSGRYLHFMRWMAQRGVGCHALDLRGQGKSPGRRGYVRHWTDYVDDLTAFLKLDVLQGPLFLLGQSHGALVVTIAAERGLLPTVRGCVLCSPFFRNGMQIPPAKVYLSRIVGSIIPWLPVRSGVKVEWLSSDQQMRDESKDDPLQTRVATPRWYQELLPIQREAISNADKFRHPLLLAVGDADPLAVPQASIDFFNACGSADKALQVYRGQLHELLRDTRRIEVFNDIRNWMRVQWAGLSVRGSGAADNLEQQIAQIQRDD